MTDREKVIRGLECCLAVTKCGMCPYYTEDDLWCGNNDQLLADALALLKAQEARVMTLKEAQTTLHNDDVVWVELKDKIICGGIRMDGTDYFTMQNGDVLDVTDFDSGEGAEMYGKEVRCWTSLPSKEEMEATPWN